MDLGNDSSQGCFGKCGLCAMQILFSFGKWDLGCVLFPSKGWGGVLGMRYPPPLPPVHSLHEILIYWDIHTYMFFYLH